MCWHSIQPVTSGLLETMARAIHADYQRRMVAAGAGATADASLMAWEDLPPDRQASNRDQAAHIAVKLRMVGCSVARLTEWDADGFAFTPEEVEYLSRVEHERWMAERAAAGWRWGPVTDRAARITEDMVPWESLDEPAREKDRDAVRALPAVLAAVGLHVHRVSGGRG